MFERNIIIDIQIQWEIMGKCEYCGESAGLLKNEHEECKDKYQAGKEKIIGKVQKAVFAKIDLGILGKEIRKIAKDSFINDEELKPSIIKGWESAVKEELNKGFITDRHEALTDNFIKFFEIEPVELNQNF